MLKKIFVLSALMLMIFASVGECWYGGITKIKIEQVTGWYITEFSMQHYREKESNGAVYTSGRIIFNGDGYWHDFAAKLNQSNNELLKLEIDGRLLLNR